MKTRKHTLTVAGALALLAGALAALPVRAAIEVYGVGASTGEHISVDLYANIPGPPIVSYSLKLFYDPRQLEVTTATHDPSVWRLFDGTATLPYAAPDASRPGEILFLGACLDAGNPRAGVAGDGVPLGRAVFRRSDPSTPLFRVSLGRPESFAAFVTTTGIALEALPGEVAFGPVTPTRHDRDLDGLIDAWEVKFFGDPAAAYFANDSDEDGMNELAEAAAGSDPTDPDSNLRLQISWTVKGVRLDWTSFEKRTYTVEAAGELGGFRPVRAGIAATPPANSVELPAEAGVRFFRVRLE